MSGVREQGGIFETEAEALEGRFVNHDLAPTRIKDRRWGTRDIAALWISM